jgi:hypothetical protein
MKLFRPNPLYARPSAIPEVTRSAIRAAGFSEFSRRDFACTRVDRIARRARIHARDEQASWRRGFPAKTIDPQVADIISWVPNLGLSAPLDVRFVGRNLS